MANQLHFQGLMRFVLLACLLSACVADVSGTHQESENPDPTGSEGTGSGSDPTGETTTTPTGYLEQIASIYCNESFSCEADYPPTNTTTFSAAWGASTDECEQRLLDAWNPAAIETEIAKGRAMYDGSAGIACLAGVTFGTCADYWTAGIHWADACYHVIVGLVPAGGACDNQYACVSQSCDATNHVCL